MKICLLATAWAISIVFANPTEWIKRWNSEDIKLFLNDRKVEFDQSFDDEKLSKIAIKELQSLIHPKKTIIDVDDPANAAAVKAATDPKKSLKDYLHGSESDYLDHAKSIKDWVFSTWSNSELKALLRAKKVKFKRNATTVELARLARENYDAIAKSKKLSGNYLGDWLFEAWSESDIRNWLDRHEIDYDAKGFDRQKLIELAKDHAFAVSQSILDSRLSFLDTLNIDPSTVLDKAGKVKKDVYDSWSYSQLREWLYIHNIIDTKPGVYSKDLSLSALKKLAVANGEYLADDLESWTKPVVDAVANSSNSFFAGINKWLKPRLQEFLQARDVAFSKFASKKDLVELVKSHRNSPALSDSVSFIKSWIMENLSTEAMQEWLQQVGQQATGTREEIIAVLLGYLLSNPKELRKPLSINEQLKYYLPDLAQYRDWLVSQGINVESAGESAISDTFDLVKHYYDEAGTSLESAFDTSKGNAADALQLAHDSAFQYALGAFESYKGNKNSLENHYAQAKDAAHEFCLDTLESMSQSFQEAAQAAAKFAGYSHPNLPGFLRRWFGYVGLGEIISGHARTIYMSASENAQAGLSPSTLSLRLSSVYGAASDVMVDGAKQARNGLSYATDVAGDGHASVTLVVGRGADYASQGYDAAASAASEGVLYGSQAYDAAASAASEGVLYGSQAYDAAGKVASEGVLYASQGLEAAASAANDIYDAAASYAADGALYASEGYDAAADAAADGVLYASQGYETAALYASDAKKVAPTYVSSAFDVLDGALNAGWDAANVAHKHGAHALDKAGSIAKNAHTNVAGAVGHHYAQATDQIKDLKQNVDSGWSHLLKSWSNSDLRSYLQSFGHDRSVLSKLSRKQLLGLANEQLSFIYGTEGSKWDTTISEYIERLGQAFHRKPKSKWDIPLHVLVQQTYNQILHAIRIR